MTILRCELLARLIIAENEQNYSRTEVINLFHFIDWVMSLPEELEQEFWQAVQELEEEKSMPYITENLGLKPRPYFDRLSNHLGRLSLI